MNYLQMKKKAMLNYVSGGRLPSEYQEVEYIERVGVPRTNLCYIKTGIISLADTEVEMTIEPTNDNYYHSTIGVNSSVACKQYNDNYYTPSNQLAGTVSGKVTIKAGVKSNNYRYVEINGVTTSSTASIRQQEIYLFTINNNDIPVDDDGLLIGRPALFNGKFYSVKITQSGNLERDFVPCYRKSDNEIGLYDLVYNEFYTNSGSGTFTKGQDV